MTHVHGLSCAKRTLRQQARAALALVDEASRQRAAQLLSDALLPWILRTARQQTVALFASMPDEVETRMLDRALRDARIPRALPVFAGDSMWMVRVPPDQLIDDLPRGALGIRAPAAAADLIHDDSRVVQPEDLGAVVVPGLAFDNEGGRLGRGKGYYDRLLLRVDLDRAMGVAFDVQLVHCVPLDAHDVRLRWLWTPSRGVRETFCAPTGSASGST